MKVDWSRKVKDCKDYGVVDDCTEQRSGHFTPSLGVKRERKADQRRRVSDCSG